MTAVALAAGLVGLGACGDGGSATTTTARRSTTTTAATPTTATAPLSKDFTIASLLTRDAQYATFEQVVRTAGANGRLKAKGPVTLLAPDEAAFEALGAAATDRLTSDPDAAEEFVERQLLKGKVTFGDLLGKDGGTVTTVGGEKVPVAVDGTQVTVGGAPVAKNDITASNGTIHVVSRVVQSD
ncbi:MAG: fasciclin domain-containing protein [Actinomycetes bacterium]